MTKVAGESNISPARRGRPRRIDRDAIARAVMELGTQDISMRRVADHLGMSLPGLYHHVKNLDELLEITAHHALVETPPPRYAGQHWSGWLRSYAGYIRSALAAEPALLNKFLSGALGDVGEMEYVADALDALHAQGMTPEQAMAAWSAVTALAIGSVTEAHRERIRGEQGRPWPARVAALTARHRAAAYPTLRAVAAAECDPFSDDAFQRRITLLLRGIAVECELALDGPEPHN